MTITLPNALRRAELRSFCLALSVLALIMIALATALSGVFVYGAAAILGGSLAGLAFPTLVRLPYRVWNKTAKLYARFAQRAIMALSFQCVVRVLALDTAGGSFSTTRSAQSSWVRHGQITRPAYGSQYQAADSRSIQGPWPVAVLVWAWRTGNYPAVLLLPFLLMVSVFQVEEETTQTADIYTLF